ncbi:MAG: hypothetical protein IAE99_00115 [Rhodothermales bacterium]|nr:hypothetical protein [Rhodothermales bacterium]MCA0269394.1 hypothetical protein [Bacteroidota bacterium]
MVPFRWALAATVLSSSLVVLSGCNVFESLYDSADGDAQALVASAETALQQGNDARAVDLFQKALASAPVGSSEQARAANGLATASYERNGVSVLLFGRIATDLIERFESGSTPSSVPPPGVCSFALPERAGQEIVLTSVDGYPALRASVAAIAQTRQTLAAAYSIPANPGPSYNTAALVAALRARGLSNNEIASVLINLTFAYTATAFDRIANAGGEQIRWFEIFPTTGDSYLGYCAPSVETLNAVKREASCSLGDIGFSVALLKERARLYAGESFSTSLIDDADAAYRRLSEEIGTACN